MPAPIVFVSYASDVRDWVEVFTDGRWFGGRLGNAVVERYQSGDNLPFGDLDEWLRKEIGAAAAVVLIVSKDYTEKKYTLKEWSQALSEVNRRRLVFVPVMIDADAKAWWAEQKHLGSLSELGGDYAYADFTDGSGKPVEINNQWGPVTKVTRQIGELARLIGTHLESRIADPVAPETSAAAKPAIVVLGHPVAAPLKEVAENTRGLIAGLQGVNLDPIVWRDGWRAPTARQGSGALPQTSALFVQPLGPVEAGDHADNPAAIRKWIEDAVAADMPQRAARSSSDTLVLWLPSGLQDAAFEAKLAAGPSGEGLVLRHDDPEALASWLNHHVGNAPPANVAILALEDLVEMGDLRKVRTALHDGFYKIVKEEVKPAPEPWVFWNSMLVSQLKLLKAGRVIIAIHDLNTGTASELNEAREQLELKMGDIEKAADLAGRRDLKFFRSVLLVSKSDKLPFVKYPNVKYPKPSVFEDWCLLPFIETATALEPKPDEEIMFRECLRDWVRDTA